MAEEKKSSSKSHIKMMRYLPKNVGQIREEFWEKNVFFNNDTQAGHSYKLDIPKVSISEELYSILMAHVAKNNRLTKEFSENFIRKIYPNDVSIENFYGFTDTEDSIWTKDCFFGKSTNKDEFYFSVRFQMIGKDQYREEVMLNLHIRQPFSDTARTIRSLEDLQDHLKDFTEIEIPTPLTKTNSQISGYDVSYKHRDYESATSSSSSSSSSDNSLASSKSSDDFIELLEEFEVTGVDDKSRHRRNKSDPYQNPMPYINRGLQIISRSRSASFDSNYSISNSSSSTSLSTLSAPHPRLQAIQPKSPADKIETISLKESNNLSLKT